MAAILLHQFDGSCSGIMLEDQRIITILGENVDKAPRVHCSNLSQVNKEKVMPGVDNESLF
jgi:hypothetical protein